MRQSVPKQALKAPVSSYGTATTQQQSTLNFTLRHSYRLSCTVLIAMDPSASPNLPIEIISEVASHLPAADVLNLALTAKVVHEIVIGHFYRTISVSSIREGSIDVGMQRKSIECMKTFISDEKKRQGVETLILHGIGVLTV